MRCCEKFANLAGRQGVALRTLVERGLRPVLAEKKHGTPFRLRRASFKGKGLEAEFRDTSWETPRDVTYEDRGG